MSFNAHIVTYAWPAYCCDREQIVVRRGDTEVVYRVVKVERPHRNEEDRHTNGSKPCLLYIEGEPYPWYVESGWDHLRVFSQDHHGGDD